MTEKIKQFEKEKRNEIMWSLSVQQEYPPVVIQRIFNFKHMSTVKRILASMPVGWKSPWSKRGV